KYCLWIIAKCHFYSFISTNRHKPFITFFLGKREEGFCKRGIVFNYEYYIISFLNTFSVVWHIFRNYRSDEALSSIRFWFLFRRLFSLVWFNLNFNRLLFWVIFFIFTIRGNCT